MSKFKVGDRVSIIDLTGFDGSTPPTTHGVIAEPVNEWGYCMVAFEGWTEGTDNPAVYAATGELVFNIAEIAPDEMVHLPKAPSSLHPFERTILKHLQARKSISPMEALTSYGTARLAPKILNLRKAGFEIVTKIMSDHPGHRYARYTLVEKVAT